jgi:hypothetical protein
MSDLKYGAKRGLATNPKQLQLVRNEIAFADKQRRRLLKLKRDGNITDEEIDIIMRYY